MALNIPEKSKDDPEIADAFCAFMEGSIEGARRILESAKRKGKLRSKFSTRHHMELEMRSRFFLISGFLSLRKGVRK